MLNVLEIDYKLREMREYFKETYPSLKDLSEMRGIIDWDKKKKIGFDLWIEEGCEGCSFYFYPSASEGIYKCQSFTKTEYAEDFINAHITVCEMLDSFKQRGFNVKVSDEGEYFKSRDIKLLAKNKGLSEDVLNSTIGLFKSLGMEVITGGDKAHFEIKGDVDMEELKRKLKERGGIMIEIDKGEGKNDSN